MSRGLIGAFVPAVAPPLRRVTPHADDEVGVTPPASNLPAPRMLVHRVAPSWCDRREELEPDHARVRNTGRTSASLEGSGWHPGPPSLRRPLRRGLPRLRGVGRILGASGAGGRPSATPGGVLRLRPQLHRRPAPGDSPAGLPPPLRRWVPGPRRSRRKWDPRRPAVMALLPAGRRRRPQSSKGEGVHPGDERHGLGYGVGDQAAPSALEAFYAAYAKDPRHFVRVWRGCLDPSDSERVAGSIEEVLECAREATTPSGRNSWRRSSESGRQSRAHGQRSTPSSNCETARCARALRGARHVDHSVRAGPSPRELARYWRTHIWRQRWRTGGRSRTAPGIVVEARSFALVRSRHGGLDALLATAPRSGDERTIQSWRYATLLGLLWRRQRAASVAKPFGLGNPFADVPDLRSTDDPAPRRRVAARPRQFRVLVRRADRSAKHERRRPTPRRAGREGATR